MSDIDFSSLPSKFETVEDYDHLVQTFLLPFFQNRAKQLVSIIDDLHAYLEENDELSQEQINLYVNELRGVVGFALKNSPFYPFFERFVQFEDRLIREGLITSDET